MRTSSPLNGVEHREQYNYGDLTPFRRVDLQSHLRLRAVLAALAFGVLMVGCSTSSDANNGSDQPSDESANSESTSSTDDLELGEPEQTAAVDPEEADISEEAAEEPVVADDEIVEVDVEQVAESPQDKVGVTEAALCATVQIGADAASDGDAELAKVQRDLIIERAANVADKELRAALTEISADDPLEREAAEAGLRRCEALGFEL